MSKRAKSTFTVDSRDNAPVAWDGGQVMRGRWTKTFTGDLTGQSFVEILLGGVEAGARFYVGAERIDGTLDGKKGTFVLLHTATMLGETSVASWRIVEGSGTGELAGIRGTGEITPDHDFYLDYEI